MTVDEAPELPPPPPLSDRWALFLDVDGTLLAFADHPDRVAVPQGLVPRLVQLQVLLDGALALVSGRRIETLDRLFAPLQLAAAGMHGLQRRRAGEALAVASPAPAAFEAVKHEARGWLQRYPEAVVEDKGEAVGLHWRAMPDAATDLQAFAQAALARLPGYHLQPGDHLVELRPQRADKGDAIADFMTEAPFAGRRPVFVGDDLTDEHGFEVVEALGGLGILVGNRHGSVARHRLPDIPATLAWLGVAADNRD